MKAYFQAFVKFKKNYWAQLFSMAEFTYNNIKNISINYTFFIFNCKYYLCIFYNKNFDLCLKLKTVKKISFEL